MYKLKIDPTAVAASDIRILDAPFYLMFEGFASALATADAIILCGSRGTIVTRHKILAHLTSWKGKIDWDDSAIELVNDFLKPHGLEITEERM